MPPRTAQKEMAGLGNSNPIPAPIKGLNTREGFTALAPDEARVLENILPDQGGVFVRPGWTNYCAVTGASSVPTLATYKGASGLKLVAAGNGGIWDVTGTSPSNIAAALTYGNDRWVTESFNGYLFGVNGQDTPWRYNGSSIGATGFSGSGLTLENLQTVSLVKGRLWFTEINSADVWYGPSAGVTGTLTKFQLSQIAQGGKCVGIGAWSYEGGGGPNDQTVFIMDTGEVLVYGGDPATTFSKVGSYSAPKPVGLNSFVKIGGELIIITANGPIPISFIYRGVAFDLTQLQVWGKISPSWQADFKTTQSYLGWFGHYFNGILYLNVPLSASSSKQYVLNTRVPAWTTYTNLPVGSMADIGGSLYFGSCTEGYINSHSTGSDNGAQIVTLARQAFSFPMGKNRSVQWTMLRPNIEANGSASGQFQVDVDFLSGSLDSPIIDLLSISPGAAWGDPWGSVWGTEPETERQFISVVGYGCAVSPVVRTYSVADRVVWYSSDLVGVQGGIL